MDYYIIPKEIADEWVHKDAKMLQWWCDLLRLCHKGDDAKIVIRNGVEVKVEKHQIATSSSELAERWNVCRQTVDKFLKLLSCNHIIVNNTINNRIRLLTISALSNYESSIGGGINRCVNRSVNRSINKCVNRLDSSHNDCVSETYDNPANKCVNRSINSIVNSTKKEEEKKKSNIKEIKEVEKNITGEISAHTHTREEAEVYYPTGKSVMGDMTPCYTIDEYVDAMRSKSRQWQESVMMQLGIDQQTLGRLLDEFLLNCKTTAEPTHPSLGKAKGHFVRWATRNINKATPTKNGTTNKSSLIDYAERQFISALNKQR